MERTAPRARLRLTSSRSQTQARAVGAPCIVRDPMNLRRGPEILRTDFRAVETQARNAKNWPRTRGRSEEHTSELQSLMRTSYAVFCLQKKKQLYNTLLYTQHTMTYN